MVEPFLVITVDYYLLHLVSGCDVFFGKNRKKNQMMDEFLFFSHAMSDF